MQLRPFLPVICAAFSLYSCATHSASTPTTTSVDFDIAQRPLRLERREKVSGGKCIAILRYHPVDNTKFTADLDQNGSDPSCRVVDVTGSNPLLVNGQPLLNSSETITFGTGTTTCYGPPIPNPPRCFCTASPCP